MAGLTFEHGAATSGSERRAFKSQLNKVYGSELLVSAEVLREAGEAFEGAESLGPVQVKGRDEPIEIYRLV